MKSGISIIDMDVANVAEESDLEMEQEKESKTRSRGFFQSLLYVLNCLILMLFICFLVYDIHLIKNFNNQVCKDMSCCGAHHHEEDIDENRGDEVQPTKLSTLPAYGSGADPDLVLSLKFCNNVQLLDYLQSLESLNYRIHDVKDSAFNAEISTDDALKLLMRQMQTDMFDDSVFLRKLFSVHKLDKRSADVSNLTTLNPNLETPPGTEIEAKDFGNDAHENEDVGDDVSGIVNQTSETNVDLMTMNTESKTLQENASLKINASEDAFITKEITVETKKGPLDVNVDNEINLSRKMDSVQSDSAVLYDVEDYNVKVFNQSMSNYFPSVSSTAKSKMSSIEPELVSPAPNVPSETSNATPEVTSIASKPANAASEVANIASKASSNAYEVTSVASKTSNNANEAPNIVSEALNNMSETFINKYEESSIASEASNMFKTSNNTYEASDNAYEASNDTLEVSNMSETSNNAYQVSNDTLKVSNMSETSNNVYQASDDTLEVSNVSETSNNAYQASNDTLEASNMSEKSNNAYEVSNDTLEAYNVSETSNNAHEAFTDTLEASNVVSETFNNAYEAFNNVSEATMAAPEAITAASEVFNNVHAATMIASKASGRASEISGTASEAFRRVSEVSGTASDASNVEFEISSMPVEIDSAASENGKIYTPLSEIVNDISSKSHNENLEVTVPFYSLPSHTIVNESNVSLLVEHPEAIDHNLSESNVLTRNKDLTNESVDDPLNHRSSMIHENMNKSDNTSNSYQQAPESITPANLKITESDHKSTFLNNDSNEKQKVENKSQKTESEMNLDFRHEKITLNHDHHQKNSKESMRKRLIHHNVINYIVDEEHYENAYKLDQTAYAKNYLDLEPVMHNIHGEWHDQIDVEFDNHTDESNPKIGKGLSLSSEKHDVNSRKNISVVDSQMADENTSRILINKESKPFLNQRSGEEEENSKLLTLHDELPNARQQLLLNKSGSLFDDSAQHPETVEQSKDVNKVASISDNISVAEEKDVLISANQDPLKTAEIVQTRKLENSQIQETSSANIEKPSSFIPNSEKPQSVISVTEEPVSLISITKEPSSLIPISEQPLSLIPIVKKPPSPILIAENSSSLISVTEKPPNLIQGIEKSPSLIQDIEKPPSLIQTDEEPRSLIPIVEEPPSLITINEEPPSFISIDEEPPSFIPFAEKPPNLTLVAEKPPSLIPNKEGDQNTATKLANSDSMPVVNPMNEDNGTLVSSSKLERVAKLPAASEDN